MNIATVTAYKLAPYVLYHINDMKMQIKNNMGHF